MDEEEAFTFYQDWQERSFLLERRAGETPNVSRQLTGVTNEIAAKKRRPSLRDGAPKTTTARSVSRYDISRKHTRYAVLVF
jgi:hypothetical protein